MELKEFIKSTVQSIVDAADELGTEIDAQKAVINPKLKGQTIVIGRLSATSENAPITSISFDVAVTEEEGASVKGGVGIKIVPFQASLGGGTSSVNSTVSKIQFTLNVALPSFG
jgi:hypothetical protein